MAYLPGVMPVCYARKRACAHGNLESPGFDELASVNPYSPRLAWMLPPRAPPPRTARHPGRPSTPKSRHPKATVRSCAPSWGGITHRGDGRLVGVEFRLITGRNHALAGWPVVGCGVAPDDGAQPRIGADDHPRTTDPRTARHPGRSMTGRETNMHQVIRGSHIAGFDGCRQSSSDAGGRELDKPVGNPDSNSAWAESSHPDRLERRANSARGGQAP